MAEEGSLMNHQERVMCGGDGKKALEFALEFAWQALYST